MTSVQPEDLDMNMVRQRLRAAMGRHFGASGDVAEWLADELVEVGWENPFAVLVFERSKALAALERIDRALSELGLACSEAAMNDPRSWGGLYGEILSEGAAKGTSWLDVSMNTSHYRKAVRRAVDRIRVDPKGFRSLAQLNAKEVGLVDGCRVIWWYATGRPAPSKDLNPASKFADFLGDAIEAFGLSGEPRPAFRAWVRYAEHP